jgi:hypothetical protein
MGEPIFAPLDALQIQIQAIRNLDGQTGSWASSVLEAYERARDSVTPEGIMQMFLLEITAFPGPQAEAISQLVSMLLSLKIGRHSPLLASILQDIIPRCFDSVRNILSGSSDPVMSASTFIKCIRASLMMMESKESYLIRELVDELNFEKDRLSGKSKPDGLKEVRLKILDRFVSGLKDDQLIAKWPELSKLR